MSIVKSRHNGGFIIERIPYKNGILDVYKYMKDFQKLLKKGEIFRPLLHYHANKVLNYKIGHDPWAQRISVIILFTLLYDFWGEKSNPSLNRLGYEPGFEAVLTKSQHNNSKSS